MAANHTYDNKDLLRILKQKAAGKIKQFLPVSFLNSSKPSCHLSL